MVLVGPFAVGEWEFLEGFLVGFCGEIWDDHARLGGGQGFDSGSGADFGNVALLFVLLHAFLGS